MKTLNKCFAILLCLFLLAGLCAPAAQAATEEKTTIRIYTADDLAALSRQCALDSWSWDKTVLLERDIDLSLSDFQPIPTFGGTFDGQGHTISGLSLSADGNTRGLFRYIQTSGVVRNLTVDGAVLSGSSKSYLGGIAGNNRGTILHCVFRGNIQGESTIGGIAGINESSGQIINCSFAGTITGEHYVGGIVGQNHGSIVRCQNSGSVNITEVKATLDLEQLDLEQLNSTANLPATTDIGGIAGFSSGTIQSCHNTGDVGYPHVGYNIGGIVGRHSGYLDSCTNQGLIQGRKDVGGIAGQMEPQLMLKYDQTALDQIWDELDTLEALIDGFLEDTSGAADQLTGEVQKVSDSAYAVKDAAANLSSAMTDWVDGNISHINDASARISWVLERMVPIMGIAALSMDQIEQAFDLLSAGLDKTSLAARYGSEAAEEITLAVDNLQNAIRMARSSLSRLQSSMDAITQGLGDSDASKQAIDDISDAISEFAAAFEHISDAFGAICNAMDHVQTWVQTDQSWLDLKESINQLHFVFSDSFAALKRFSETLKEVAGDSDFLTDLEPLVNSAKELLRSFSALTPAMGSFLSAYEQFRSGNTAAAQDALELATEALQSALTGIDANIEALADTVQSIIKNSDAIKAYETLLNDHLAALGDNIQAAHNAAENIIAALDELEKSDVLSNEIAAMRAALNSVLIHLDQAADAVDTFTSGLNTLLRNVEPAAFETAWNELKASVSALESAAYNLILSAGHLSKAFTSLSAASDALADGFTRFSAAGSSMADAFGSLEQIAAEVAKVLEELSAMPAIQFDLLDGSVTDEGAALNSAADGLFSSFNTLNSVLRGQANLLTDDLQAINAQLGVITDLLQRFQQEQTSKNAEDLLVDVSDLAADDSMSNGKISSCENLGSVEGDVNVAGIVGSVAIEYDFDPEDDLTVSGSRSLDAVFLTRSVIYGCINRGAVTAKKNATGGIVGLMDLGYAAACQSYGTVTSTSGKYVGGIAGQSYGGIADCWVKCTLSGGSYVGGIAGLGTLIQNCRTLIDIPSGIPFSGAVAGQMEENGTLTGNLFVHHALAGVDGVSYDGAAQPVPYEQLIALEGIFAEFKEFSLTFTADGNTVAVIPFQYGDSLTELPEIPEKAAHSACWPEFDFSFLFFSRTLEAQYTPYDTALSDGQSLPAYLVDGSFSPSASVSVTESEVTWMDDKGNVYQVPAYTVTVTDPLAKQISYTLHWRLPEKGDYDLWVLNGSEWVRQDYIPDGSYLLLACTGEQITFCLTEQSKPPLLLFGLILLIIIIIVIVIISLIRRTNRKKKQLVALITGQ